MSRDVHLPTRREPAPKPPVDKEALLARAVGVDPSRRLQAAPAARPEEPPDGVLPLPAGRRVRASRDLTPMERRTLEDIGWTSDVPVPENMAEIVAQMQADGLKEVRAENLPPPIDPRTPPLEVKTVPIESLPPEQQAALLHRLQTGAAAPAPPPPPPPPPPTSSQAAALQSLVAQSLAVQDAAAETDAARDRMAAMGEGALAAYDAAARQARAQLEPDIVDDRAPASAPAAAAAPEAAAAVGADTGAAPTPDRCGHCGWPLAAPDVAEPPHAVKMQFLHALLGAQCFVQDAPLFGGAVTATFRSLTTRELDAIYAQGYADYAAERIKTDRDFWDKVNRYRFFLQLQAIQSGTMGLNHRFPEGLSAETAPAARSHWKGEPPEGETLLPQIEAYMLDAALQSEVLFRSLIAACSQFNRLVAKLEAMADNDPFWQATEPPS